MSEEESDYFADLITVAAGMRAPAALDTLLDPAVLDTEGIATRGPAALGGAMVDRASAAYLATSDSGYKVSILSAFETALKVPLGAAAREKILVIAMGAAQDSDRFLREGGARCLVFYADPRSAQLVDRIISSDPYVAHIRGKTFYPVRDAAALARRQSSSPRQ